MPNETYSADELTALKERFTNSDQACFALTNLDETVKGALFARYSRSPDGLRRLWLNEFRDGADNARTQPQGNKRAKRLYERVLGQYGDDSVAQLGSAHVACEGVSNVLTKILERGRLMSYLEQSTRYIPYTSKPNGRWKYLTPPEIAGTPNGNEYEETMDWLFKTYAKWVPKAVKHFTHAYPKHPDEQSGAYDRAIRAQALDAMRGLLPAATRSNVGIHGSGQAFEQLVLRLLSHSLLEAQELGKAMLAQLRHVIPAFVQRVDRPERGERTQTYLRAQKESAKIIARRLGQMHMTPQQSDDDVQLLEWDANAETRVVAMAAREACSAPMLALLCKAGLVGDYERGELLRIYAGDRENRRHRPGRALEAANYTFEVTADYGAFRDLQRHRILSMEWEPLSVKHGRTTPDAIAAMGASNDWEHAMEKAELAFWKLKAQGDPVAQYAVPMAYKIRFCMRLNAREAMHMLELRTQPAGHPSYRRVCQKMHELIKNKAGHRHIARMMKFVNHETSGLGRREAEQRTAEAKPQQT